MSLEQNLTGRNGASDWRKVLGLGVELSLLLFVIYYFKLESQAFFHLAALASAGFLVHYFLPFRFRLPFFLALSLAGTALVLGWQAGWLIALGMALIGICHLPAPFSVLGLVVSRSGLLLAGTERGVRRSLDGGTSWENPDDAARLPRPKDRIDSFAVLAEIGRASCRERVWIPV